MRVANPSATSTAGNPMPTDREIMTPSQSKAFAVAKSTGPSDVIRNQAATVIWPANIATNANKPHRLVPMKFHIRGERFARDEQAGAAASAELSGKLISGKLINGPCMIEASGQRSIEQAAALLWRQIRRTVHGATRWIEAAQGEHLALSAVNPVQRRGGRPHPQRFHPPPPHTSP